MPPSGQRGSIGIQALTRHHHGYDGFIFPFITMYSDTSGCCTAQWGQMIFEVVYEFLTCLANRLKNPQ